MFRFDLTFIYTVGREVDCSQDNVNIFCHLFHFIRKPPKIIISWINFYILRCDFYFFFFFYDHPDLQNWRVSANFKPYMNYWSRDSSRIYYWKWVSPWHISTWCPIFSEALHFGHSVVVPNHICIAFNYQIYKFLVLNFYLICFFHEIIILGGFLMKWKRWQKILSVRSEVLPRKSDTMLICVKERPIFNNKSVSYPWTNNSCMA
jgi:hypothetical protein